MYIHNICILKCHKTWNMHNITCTMRRHTWSFSQITNLQLDSLATYVLAFVYILHIFTLHLKPQHQTVHITLSILNLENSMRGGFCWERCTVLHLQVLSFDMSYLVLWTVEDAGRWKLLWAVSDVQEQELFEAVSKRQKASRISWTRKVCAFMPSVMVCVCTCYRM